MEAYARDIFRNFCPSRPSLRSGEKSREPPPQSRREVGEKSREKLLTGGTLESTVKDSENPAPD
jgi:hypothetical protein